MQFPRVITVKIVQNKRDDRAILMARLRQRRSAGPKDRRVARRRRLGACAHMRRPSGHRK